MATIPLTPNHLDQLLPALGGLARLIAGGTSVTDEQVDLLLLTFDLHADLAARRELLRWSRLLQCVYTSPAEMTRSAIVQGLMLRGVPEAPAVFAVVTVTNTFGAGPIWSGDVEVELEARVMTISSDERSRFWRERGDGGSLDDHINVWTREMAQIYNSIDWTDPKRAKEKDFFRRLSMVLSPTTKKLDFTDFKPEDALIILKRYTLGDGNMNVKQFIDDIMEAESINLGSAQDIFSRIYDDDHDHIFKMGRIFGKNSSQIIWELIEDKARGKRFLHDEADRRRS